MYSFFVFRGQASISDSSRTDLFIGLSGASLLGVLALFFLRKKRPSDIPSDAIASLNARYALNWLILIFYIFGYGECGRTSYGRTHMVQFSGTSG